MLKFMMIPYDLDCWTDLDTEKPSDEEIARRFGFEDEYNEGTVTWWQNTKHKAENTYLDDITGRKENFMVCLKNVNIARVTVTGTVAFST